MSTRDHGQAHADELLDALVQTSFDVIGVVSRVAAAHDLSLTQLRMIAILRDHQPTLSQLADHLGLDRSTISGLIDRAVARDLVERVANPDDRRSSRVALTRAGQTLAKAGAGEVAQGVAPLVSRLEEDERERLTRLLQRVIG